MYDNDTYQTIKSTSEGIFKDKGSKFFSFAIPVSSENEAKQKIDDLKKKYHDARHHCFAYVIGFKAEKQRAFDDGEPSNSAGKPILNQITSKNITNTLVVVVRYFGGTLLGVGGLINAYKSAALDALTNAQFITLTIKENVEIFFDSIYLNEVMKILKDEKLEIKSQLFDVKCCIEILIPKSKIDKINNQFSKIQSLNIKFMSNQ